MFERFTKPARTTVQRAVQLAQDARATEVGPEHLLLAMTESEESVAVQALTALGAGPEVVATTVHRLELKTGTAAGLGPEDAVALQAIGIDLEEVLRRVGDNLGEDLAEGGPNRSGRPRFAKESKKVLELALREAIALKHNYIGTEHLLLGLLRTRSGVVPWVWEELELSHAAVREAVTEQLRRAG